VGLTVIDRFTFFMVEFLERLDAASNATLDELVQYVRCLSHAVRHRLCEHCAIWPPCRGKVYACILS
jgi:hypothetical protein